MSGHQPELERYVLGIWVIKPSPEIYMQGQEVRDRQEGNGVIVSRSSSRDSSHLSWDSRGGTWAISGNTHEAWLVVSFQSTFKSPVSGTIDNQVHISFMNIVIAPLLKAF